MVTYYFAFSPPEVEYICLGFCLNFPCSLISGEKLSVLISGGKLSVLVFVSTEYVNHYYHFSDHFCT